MHTELLQAILVQTYSLAALGILLLASGLVCVSETAIFSLSHYDRTQIREVSPRIATRIDYLLNRPEALLLLLMMANMAANSLAFTVSSLLVYQFVKAGHPVFAGAIGVATLVVLVLFMEILAKGAIYYLRVRASLWVALPIYLLLRVLEYPLTVVQKAFITPLVRLVIGPSRETAVSKKELLDLFEIAGQDQYLQAGQVDLLRRVVELRDLRVRQVMIPRVDMPACEIHKTPEEIKAEIRETHRTRMAAYVYQIDYIVGLVRTRRLLVEQPKRTKDVLERVRFVPEHQRVDQLLHFFHREKTDVAMVVDEYGGLLGMVSLDELVERTIGQLRSEFPDPDAPKLRTIRPGEYRVDGHYSLVAFFEQIKVPLPDVEVGTLAGLAMHLAGHLPQENETLSHGPLRLTVEKVEANRIEKILVTDTRRAGA